MLFCERTWYLKVITGISILDLTASGATIDLKNRPVFTDLYSIGYRSQKIDELIKNNWGEIRQFEVKCKRIIRTRWHSGTVSKKSLNKLSWMLDRFAGSLSRIIGCIVVVIVMILSRNQQFYLNFFVFCFLVCFVLFALLIMIINGPPQLWKLKPPHPPTHRTRSWSWSRYRSRLGNEHFGLESSENLLELEAER